MHLCKLCALSKRQMINFEWRWNRNEELQRDGGWDKVAAHQTWQCPRKKSSPECRTLETRFAQQWTAKTRRLIQIILFQFRSLFVCWYIQWYRWKRFFPACTTNNWLKVEFFRRREFWKLLQMAIFQQTRVVEEKKLSTVDDFYKLYFIILIPIACVGAVCFQ